MTTKQNIETILKKQYGCNAVVAPMEAVLWATEMIEDKASAQSELKRINKIRARKGVPVVHAPYGYKAF